MRGGLTNRQTQDCAPNRIKQFGAPSGLRPSPRIHKSIDRLHGFQPIVARMEPLLNAGRSYESADPGLRAKSHKAIWRSIRATTLTSHSQVYRSTSRLPADRSPYGALAKCGAVFRI